MEQQYVTDSGERLKLRLKPNNRLGVGGQGQVFRASLAGVPVAVKLLREVQFHLAFKEPRMHGASMVVARLVGKWPTAWSV